MCELEQPGNLGTYCNPDVVDKEWYVLSMGRKTTAYLVVFDHWLKWWVVM